VCAETDDMGLAHLLRDPLIRLVMRSDGVTDEAMTALVMQVRRSLAARRRATCGLTRLRRDELPSAGHLRETQHDGCRRDT
jgi:hypothetical protein